MTAYSLEWLLELLQTRKLIDVAVRRDVEVRAPQQRARLAKQYGEQSPNHRGAARYSPSPVELVASFHLSDGSGVALDDERLSQLVAEAAGLAYHKIDPLSLDMKLITRTLSRPFALRHVVLPLARQDATLTVAVENPFDLEVVESLRRLVRCRVERVVASKRDILKAITEIYGFRTSVESAAREAQAQNLSDFEQLVRLRSVGEIEATDQHIVNAVDFLLRYAFDQRASDIHIEPRKSDTQVRLRIDGVLHNVHTIPRQVQPAVASRLKTMARMDIAEKRRPQDGRIKTVFDAREVELRVSSLPVAFGEKMVIRIFDPDALLVDLEDLGFEGTDLAVFQRWIGRPHGLILITGPTGSGKTTTLYTTLKTLADDSVNVTSVEDPIEMVTERFNQVAVQPRVGVDFPSAMRTILRQDPDIIMVGEIRDAPTAEMAIEAALTGHLVLSTLHTNDSVGAVTRLADLGVPRFLLSSTLVGVMAQRLVRKVCADCRQRAPLTADEIAALAIAEPELTRFAQTAAGAGCPNCRNTGYRGRIGVFELLDIDERVGSLVASGASEDALRGAALAGGMRTLRACALDRLAQGITGAGEVIRVTGVSPGA